MERLIELFINTEDGEFYDRGGLLAAYDPAINAGELVRLTVQLCAGVPAFNSAGALLNPDTTFAGTLAAAETIIDNNFNWYDKGTLLENLTTGTAISELSVASEAAPRQLGAVRLNAGTVVNFCGWTATEGGYRLTLADNEFNPAQFTPAADFAQGAAVEVLEQPIIVSAQNDDSGRATGLFTGLLDAANPVYESMIEGQEDIPNCRIEFSIYQDGRAVFRARRYFDCLGAMAMNKGAAYVHSDSWREADSRYIKLVDWQAPPEYQFSEDGTNWHDQQQDADLYYHERRPGGQWGGAVKMKIGPTGAAAGFGTPTVAVESLPAGSDATASVAASGDNTAKVFSFSFGIPKGTDGQNGTDGVSSYTYVAYASDASGAGFSLTPTNALKYRAEIHTATAIETPDAEDFAGATWVKYLGDDGTGAGDMTKSVYDTNDDGIVDHAATADAVGATTAAQVADAVGKAHTHANKATLDKLAEADGKLTFDGSEIGGASSWDDITGKPATFPPAAHNHAITDVTGLEDALQNAGTVKSVNGQLPDESGNVTVETGSTVDESRLLKVPTSADEGKLPVIRADKIPAVYHDTTLAAIVIEDGKVIDKISGKELTKVGNPQIIDGGIHSPTNSDYYMLELEGVEGLPVAVSFDYQGDESPDSSNIVVINEVCAYYSMNGRSFCRSQGGGNNIKIDNQPVGISEAYRNYVMQVSSDNYESKTPPVAFIAGESKSPTYEGSFPAMSPLSSVKVCGRFGKIRNILIGSAFPYTGNFTPRGDGVEGFGVPEKLEPGWNYETLDEAANGRLLPANPANGDIPCFDATATIGGGNDETVKFLLQPATTDGELIDSAAGAVTPATITNHSLTVSESGEIEFSSSKYATVPASGILADVLRHDKPWVFDLLVYLDQTSSQSRFFGTESGGDFFCQWTGDYGFDFKYGDTWISTLTGNVGEWNLLTLEYYQKNGTWHVALYLQGVLCQDKEISTSFDPKTSELAIGRSTSGSYLCSGKIRVIRIREGALYNGQSFTPDEFPYQEPQTVGEWGKLNKSALVQSVNSHTPDASGAVTLPEATTSEAGLMAAEDKAVIAGLTARGIYPNARTKAGAVDFNEVIDHGMYFIGGDTPHLNYPETYQQNGGTLQVIRYGNTLTQMFIPININKAFIRSCLNGLSDSSERTFSAWRRALVDTDITESKAQPGYFKLPNGTIVQWGSFVITADPQTQEITLPVALSSIYSKQVSGSNSSLKIGIYGGTNGKITCYVEGSTSGTVDWMVIGK